MEAHLIIRTNCPNVKALMTKGYVEKYDSKENPFDPTWKYRWTEKGLSTMQEFIQNLANLG